DVNEEGTEAAAVTAGVMGLTSCAMPVEPVQFKVDRPFMLALMDSKTGEVLFLGSIGEPK
ncbi:MAG TPA: serpin family protein, partial [Candidatus Obscuribacter sp.]|nr:serpin family protein [Candidatus Obscuribacter sp.]